MPSRLAIETHGDTVYLEGVIDESASLQELAGRAATNKMLILDLGGITFINSLGVREWIRMQQAAKSVGVGFELRRVAVPLVHQLNIVPAARSASMVTSFCAPYECEYCDAEHDMVLDVRTHGADLARMRPPQLPCPDCKRPLLFGAPAELYFTFLAG